MFLSEPSCAFLTLILHKQIECLQVMKFWHEATFFMTIVTAEFYNVVRLKKLSKQFKYIDIPTFSAFKFDIF